MTSPYYTSSLFTKEGFCGDEKQIFLNGELFNNISRNEDTPIEVSLFSEGIYIHFNANLGNVTITVTNSNGVTVYNNTVNSAVQTTVFIPTNGWTSGNYCITISNAIGSAVGEFNI